MLNILGMIILIIILLIIIILAIGIKVSLNYEKKGRRIKGCLKIFILKKIKVMSHEFPSEDDEDDEEEGEEKKQRDVKKILKLARPCLKDFKIYLSSVLNSISITRLDNHLIFGLDDYADTGMYIGMIWAVLATINPMHEKLCLSAEPSFNGSVFDVRGINEIEIHIFKLAIPTIKLISKKPVRKFIRGVWDER